jgi:hypothetical protein
VLADRVGDEEDLPKILMLRERKGQIFADGVLRSKKAVQKKKVVQKEECMISFAQLFNEIVE